jgi:hypothetical protein
MTAWRQRPRVAAAPAAALMAVVVVAMLVGVVLAGDGDCSSAGDGAPSRRQR